MNIKRFHAATSREALAKARMAFGDGTLILSNRQTADGVEVMATAEDSLSGNEEAESGSAFRPLQLSTRATDAITAAAVPASAERNPVEEDTEKLAMSTLSFQDYVRERMLRRRHEALSGPAPEPGLPSFMDRPKDHEPERVIAPTVIRHNPLRSSPVEPLIEPAFKREDSKATATAAASAAAQAAIGSQKNVLHELQAMKDLIEDRFHTLSWLGQARQDPIQSNLMLKLIRAGYSPTLARAMLERMPEELSAPESVRWLMEVLERNLKTDQAEAPFYEQGGVFALVGATGVGKTTTTAKLAAMCARTHGPSSVGLITLDTYRVGAHEQLRTYGRMLGVVAHLAHDQAALQDLLGLLSSKKMVLIDTTGVAPRDPRKQDMLEVLDLPNVNRLLVLNAGSHGDTQDDVLSAFKTEGSQRAILSKVDEAVKIGPAIDALIRHQMILSGVTNGQRVPEDWERADAGQLIASSMRSPTRSAFDPKATDMNFIFSHSPDRARDQGLLHV